MLLSSFNFSFSSSFRNYIIFIWWRFNLSNDSDRHEKMLQVSNFCVLGVGWCRKHVSACLNPRLVAYGKNITSNILESVKYEGHDAAAVMFYSLIFFIALFIYSIYLWWSCSKNGCHINKTCFAQVASLFKIRDLTLNILDINSILY